MTKRATFGLNVAVNLDATPGAYDNIHDWLAAVHFSLMSIGASYEMQVVLVDPRVDGESVEAALEYEKFNEAEFVEGDTVRFIIRPTQRDHFGAEYQVKQIIPVPPENIALNPNIPRENNETGVGHTQHVVLDGMDHVVTGALLRLVRRAYDYPFIRVWGELMGSMDYYIESEINRARKEGAPKNAIAHRHPNGWHVFDEGDFRRSSTAYRHFLHHGYIDEAGNYTEKTRALLR